MSSDAYDTVFNQVQLLSPDEQFQLLEDLVVMLRQQNARNPQHSILEFEGLGKEMWESVDVDDYINQERDSWSNSSEKTAMDRIEEMLSILRKSSREQAIFAEHVKDMYDNMAKVLQKDANLIYQPQETPPAMRALGEYIRQERDS